MRTLNDAEELIVEYETRTRQRVSQNQRIKMPDRRKTFNEAARITTNLVIEASSSQSISHPSEIKVRISRRTTFRLISLIKREAKSNRRQSFKQARRLKNYQEL